MRRAIFTSLRPVLTLAGISLLGAFAMYGESTVGTPRQEISQQVKFKLKGDDKAVTFTSLWETELNNNDGYQDGCSMAVSGKTIYLCVRQFDPLETGEDRSHIFIRRFNSENGEELTPWVIECPDKYKMLKREQKSSTSSYTTSDYENFSITNDADGNLLLVSLNAPKDWWTKGTPNVTMIPLSNDGKLIESQAVTCATIPLTDDCYNSSGKDLSALPRIDKVTGNIADQAYTVSFLPCFTAGQTNSYYAYITIDVSVADSGELVASCNNIPSNFLENALESLPSNITLPELHVITDNENYAVFNIGKVTDVDGNTSASATYLFNRTSNNFKFKEKASYNDMAGSPISQDVAKTFYTFKHGNHIIAVYPYSFDKENGSQFIITEWTDPSTFSSLSPSPDFLYYPAEPFKYPTNVAKSSFRQLMISRSMDPDEISSPLARSEENEGPVSDIYVCSPGSGIAALRIAPAPIITSVDDILAYGEGSVRLKSENNVLKIFGMPTNGTERLTITDIEGRTVYNAVPSSNELPLDSFGHGIYIAAYGPAHLKIVVK